MKDSSDPYLEVTVLGHPRLIPAGPRTIKVKDRWGRRTDEKVVGYESQPRIQVYTDPGGMRVLDPRTINMK